MNRALRFRVCVSVVFVVCLCLTLFGVASAQSYNLGGKTVSFLLHGGLVTVFDSPEMLDKRLQVEKDFNCKIEVLEIQWDQYVNTVTRRLMSGESAYDVISHIGSGDIVTMMTQGALMPLDNVLPEVYRNNVPSLSKDLMESLRYKGNLYAFVTGSSSAIDMMEYVAYNKEMFESMALPDPYELYLNDEWTWDTFTDIAKKLTVDIDNDGAIDQWGFDVFPTISVVLSNDGRYVRSIDGKMTFTADEKNVVEALNQMDAWWQAGIFRGYGPDAFVAGKTGMFYMNQYVLRDLLNPATGAWDVDFDFGIVPVPKGPSATGYRGAAMGFNYACLPANSAEPGALIALVNALYPCEQLIDGTMESFRQWAPNRESYEVLVDSITKWEGATDPYFGLVADGWGGFQRGDKDWSSFLASIKPEKQGALDDIFGK